MGLQKYRADEAREPDASGAIAWVANWMYGPSLSKIENCMCSDSNRRTAYVQGEADSVWTIPAAVSVNGKRAPGYLTCDENGYEFHFTRS